MPDGRFSWKHLGGARETQVDCIGNRRTTARRRPRCRVAAIGPWRVPQVGGEGRLVHRLPPSLEHVFLLRPRQPGDRHMAGAARDRGRFVVGLCGARTSAGIERRAAGHYPGRAGLRKLRNAGGCGGHEPPGHRLRCSPGLQPPNSTFLTTAGNSRPPVRRRIGSRSTTALRVLRRRATPNGWR